MKAYILTEKDLDNLVLRIDRNPKHGTEGGSRVALSEQERKAHDEAHRFFNFQVRRWIDEVKQ